VSRTACLVVLLVSDRSRRQDSFGQLEDRQDAFDSANQPLLSVPPSVVLLRSSSPSVVSVPCAWPSCLVLDARSKDLRWGGGSLLGGDVLEFDRRFIVWPSTCRTQSVHRRLDIVEAELAYLYTGALTMEVPEAAPPSFRGNVPGSRKDTGGSSCRTGRTPRRIAGSIHPRRRRQTGLAVYETW
jgi:hypothetical protein